MQKPQEYSSAVAYLQGSDAAPKLMGQVLFTQKAEGVLVTAQVFGLPETETGFFGFHIHEKPCSGEDFSGAGAHYNPKELPHPRHAGDLPPLLSCGGKAELSVLTNRVRLEELLGRSVVIHDGTDDFRTQPAGDAGLRIACGTIQRL